MGRLKLFYPKNEIQSGFYANPGEFVLEDGTEYIGPYCKADNVLVTGNTVTNKSRIILSQEIYHAHYTANLIEDQIRQIRKEDYQWRKRYDEVKKENMGESG